MLLRILILCLSFVFFQKTVEGGVLDNFLNRRAVQPAPTVRVLLVYDRPGVVLEVKGRYRLYDPKENELLSTRFEGKRKYIQSLTDGLQWGEEFPGVHQLVIVPDHPSVTTVVDGIEYRGSIYVYDVEGKISIVNEVDIEDYLASILAPKIRENYAPEFLAALAISARTNAYYHVQNPQSNFWDVDSKKVDYRGNAMANGKSPIEKAIMSTRYMIMSQAKSDAENAVPFIATWEGKESDAASVASKISSQEAEALAKKGQHAAQILTKAFPNTSMILMHYGSK